MTWAVITGPVRDKGVDLSKGDLVDPRLWPQHIFRRFVAEGRIGDLTEETIAQYRAEVRMADLRDKAATARRKLTSAKSARFVASERLETLRSALGAAEANLERLVADEQAAEARLTAAQDAVDAEKGRSTHQPAEPPPVVTVDMGEQGEPVDEAGSPAYSREDLEELSVREIRAEAEEAEIELPSRGKKADIIDAFLAGLD